jgi:hypothetical protein
MVLPNIRRDPQQPQPGRPRFAQLVSLFPSAEECFLRHVLSQLGPPSQPPRVTENGLDVLFQW